MSLNLTPTGVLTETPFVELAGALHRKRLTGSLYLNDQRPGHPAERVVYFSHGEVYAAASNLPMDSALALLVRAGRVTKELSVHIQQEVVAGKSFSELLVKYGCVTRDELNQLRIEHVKSIFTSLCEWTSGTYRYADGGQIAGGRLGVSTKALLTEGALVSRVPQHFIQLMTDSRTWISADQTATPDMQLPPFAYFLLSCLGQSRNLVILIESGRMEETDQDVWQQLYGLSCAGLVDFTTALSPAENPLLTGRETQNALAAKPKPVESVVPEAVTCTALAFPLQEDPETAKRRKLESIKRDIKNIRQILSSANDDYAVLGVQTGATPTDVKHAYRKLVNHYHPDRHHPYCDPITLATLSDVLMAIRASYETAIEHALLAEIINTNSRRYKAMRETKRESGSIVYEYSSLSTDPRQSERKTAEAMQSRNMSMAEVKHRRAISHQMRGEYEAAIGLLTDAVTLAPDCARYHGDLAALLEKVPMRREQAEHHLLRATELEPSNLFYHLQLGSFYRAVGMLSRAEQQFVLALKLDPVDRAAASALEEVVSLRKAQASNSQYGRKTVSKGQGFWARIFNRSEQ